MVTRIVLVKVDGREEELVRIAVFGAGHVGLVTGLCFAEKGHEVICVDSDASKIQRLKSGDSLIYEPGIVSLLQSQLLQKRIVFTTEAQEAIQQSEVLFVAVGTSFQEDGSVNVRSVMEVIATISSCMRGFKVIVMKSTVPPGTSQELKQWISSELKKRGEAEDFEMVSNPEFLREGAALEDGLRPSRIVVGQESPRARLWMEKVYASYLEEGTPVLWMDLSSSEMSKYASNAMLATRISFMNEFAGLCEAVGADIQQVRLGLGSDPRIGTSFLQAGIGYGGSCLSKDIQVLLCTAKKYQKRFGMLEAVEKVNFGQRDLFFKKIVSALGDLRGKKIAIWGLAFKPDTNDLRDAPSLTLMDALCKAQAKICAYDPVVREEVEKKYQGKVHFAEDPYEALEGAEALCLVTEWSCFEKPDFSKMKSLMKEPRIFDGRNLYRPKEVRAWGFQYESFGQC
jgi:UDPglucose 6-dehydrogenase